MGYIILVIIVLVLLFWLFFLIRALFIGFITILAVIGSLPVAALDYVSRPLAWVGINSPSACWGITGFILCGCLGFLISARSVTKSNEYKKIYYRTLLGLGILLAASLLSYSISDTTNSTGSLKNDMYVGESNIPAITEIKKVPHEAVSDQFIVRRQGSSK